MNIGHKLLNHGPLSEQLKQGKLQHELGDLVSDPILVLFDALVEILLGQHSNVVLLLDTSGGEGSLIVHGMACPGINPVRVQPLHSKVLAHSKGAQLQLIVV